MKARLLHCLATTLICAVVLSCTLHAQTTYQANGATFTPKYIVGPSEYSCFVIPTATHKLYDVAPGLPTLIGGTPGTVTAVSGALHHYCLLDDQGNCYCWGDNGNGEIGIGTASGTPVSAPTRVATDSLGNPFNNIVQVLPTTSAAGYLT